MQYQGGTRVPLLGSPLKRPAPLTSPHAPALSPLTKRPRPPVPYTTPDAARPVNPAELSPLGSHYPAILMSVRILRSKDQFCFKNSPED